MQSNSTSAISKIIATTNVHIQGVSPIAVLEDYSGKQGSEQTNTHLCVLLVIPLTLRALGVQKASVLIN